MELVLIIENTTEWDYMWNWLAQHPINDGIENPTLALHEGEVWQYMGSHKLDKKVIHTFRHRLHPVTNTTQNISVKASDTMDESMIMKKK